MPKSFKISLVGKGILIAMAISFLLTLLLSLVYFSSSIQEAFSHSLIVGGVSVFLSSFFIAYVSGSKGLYYGIAIGLGFFLLSMLIYYIFYVGNPVWIVLVKKLIVNLISGALGGTLGAIVRK